MRNKFILFGFGILLLSSCGNQSTETTQQEEQETTHEEKQESTPALHLNNGEKWTVNAETHIGMNHLQGIVDSLPDSIDFPAIAAKMETETQYIISNCDMTGEDHNQLHLVLHPILDGIRNMKEGANGEEGQKGLNTVQKNLEDYFTHFQTQ